MSVIDIDRKKCAPFTCDPTITQGRPTVDDQSNFMGDHRFSDMAYGYIIDGEFTDKPDLDLMRKEDAVFVNERHTLLNYTRE